MSLGTSAAVLMITFIPLAVDQQRENWALSGRQMDSQYQVQTVCKLFNKRIRCLKMNFHFYTALEKGHSPTISVTQKPHCFTLPCRPETGHDSPVQELSWNFKFPGETGGLREEKKKKSQKRYIWPERLGEMDTELHGTIFRLPFQSINALQILFIRSHSSDVAFSAKIKTAAPWRGAWWPQRWAWQPLPHHGHMPVWPAQTKCQAATSRWILTCRASPHCPRPVTSPKEASGGQGSGDAVAGHPSLHPAAVPKSERPLALLPAPQSCLMEGDPCSPWQLSPEEPHTSHVSEEH